AAAAIAKIEARPAPDEAGHADCPSSATTSLAFLDMGRGYRFWNVRGPIILLAPVDRWKQHQDSVPIYPGRSLASHYLHQVFRQRRRAVARQSDPRLQLS